MHVRVVAFDEVGSTLDVAHELAARGAEAGTLVVARAQTAGRGRMGRSWRSERDAGLWLTMIERPDDASSIEVLSLRVGFALAPALDAFADAPIRLKWPNDLYVGDRKLAGVLIEARWRDGRPEWVAIGVGINLRPPASEPRAVGLRSDAERGIVLERAGRAVRAAAARRGALTPEELTQFRERDFARGRACVEPLKGEVQGIDPSGALLVRVLSSADAPADEIVAVRTGSLVLQEEEA